MFDNKKDIAKKGVKKETATPSFQSHMEYFSNRIRVPQAVLDELEATDRDHRWLNYSEYQRKGNIHKSGWRPYKPDVDVKDNEYGQDANGYIRRGDLILGVRPKELSAQHREFLAKKNLRHKGYEKAAAEKLRHMSQGIGKVTEGYDKNGSET